MNTDIVEKLLRKAPPVRTPPRLLHDLQSDIVLPHSESRITNHESLAPGGWFRRWMPTVGFALWFLGCIVVFGIQASRILDLKEQNHALQMANATAVAQDSNAEARSAANAAELERLQKDLSDVQRLRAEIERLRSETQELAPLRAQNQKLREELKAQTAPPLKPEEDFFSVWTEKAARVKCIHHLKRVCLAALMWADKNKSDTFPTDKAQLEPFLDANAGGEKLLRCPTDNSTAYEFLSLGMPVHNPDPNMVFVRCPIHNNVGVVDGSAHMLGRNRKVVQRDGKWMIGE
jgi:hypothetical protein